MNHRSTSGSGQAADQREHQELQALRAQADPSSSTKAASGKLVISCEPAVFVLLFGVFFTFTCVLLLGSSRGGTKDVFEHKVKQTNGTAIWSSGADQFLPPSPVESPPPPPVPPAFPSPPPTLEGEAEEISRLREALTSLEAKRAEAEAKNVALADENERLASQLKSLRSDLMRVVDSLFPSETAENTEIEESESSNPDLPAPQPSEDQGDGADGGEGQSGVREEGVVEEGEASGASGAGPATNVSG